MYVNLPHDFKGTHMSRFVSILNQHEREISVESFQTMLEEMTVRLEADAGHIEMSFPFFMTKRAPVSGVASVMDYRASLIGERRDGKTCMWIKVVVPVTSLCPCSRDISKYGAHNQRSHVTITAKLRQHIWIEELIGIAESEASSELYGILKRTDEKFVTERAYENPKFVEDIVRDVAARLNAEERRFRLRGVSGELRVHPQSFRLRADRARQGSPLEHHQIVADDDLAGESLAHAIDEARDRIRKAARGRGAGHLMVEHHSPDIRLRGHPRNVGRRRMRLGHVTENVVRIARGRRRRRALPHLVKYALIRDFADE